MLARRTFLIGLGSAFAAPAIVRAASLMPVKAIEPLYGLAPSAAALESLCAIDHATQAMLRRAMQDLSTFGNAVVCFPDDGGVPQLIPITSLPAPSSQRAL